MFYTSMHFPSPRHAFLPILYANEGRGGKMGVNTSPCFVHLYTNKFNPTGTDPGYCIYLQYIKGERANPFIAPPLEKNIIIAPQNK